MSRVNLSKRSVEHSTLSSREWARRATVRRHPPDATRSNWTPTGIAWKEQKYRNKECKVFTANSRLFCRLVPTQFSAARLCVANRVSWFCARWRERVVRRGQDRWLPRSADRKQLASQCKRLKKKCIFGGDFMLFPPWIASSSSTGVSFAW